MRVKICPYLILLAVFHVGQGYGASASSAIDEMNILWQEGQANAFETRLEKACEDNPASLELKLIALDYRGSWKQDFEKGKELASAASKLAKNLPDGEYFPLKYALLKRVNLFDALSHPRMVKGGELKSLKRGSVPGETLLSLYTDEEKERKKEEMITALSNFVKNFKEQWEYGKHDKCKELAQETPRDEVNGFVLDILNFALEVYVEKDFNKACDHIAQARLELLQLQPKIANKHLNMKVAKMLMDMQMITGRLNGVPRIIKRLGSKMTKADIEHMKKTYEMGTRKSFPLGDLSRIYQEYAQQIEIK